MRNADGDVIVLATGRTHSISRDEFDLKGRISFAPLSAAYGLAESGGKPRGYTPLEENMKIGRLAKLIRKHAELNARLKTEPEVRKELIKITKEIEKIMNRKD
jgi:hypothetical protein